MCVGVREIGGTGRWTSPQFRAVRVARVGDGIGTSHKSHPPDDVTTVGPRTECYRLRASATLRILRRLGVDPLALAADFALRRSGYGTGTSALRWNSRSVTG